MPRALMQMEIGKDSKVHIEIIGKAMAYKRSNVRLSRKEGRISAVVDAEDTRAMLASMQSILKQIRVIDSVARVAEGSEGIRPSDRKRRSQ